MKHASKYEVMLNSCLIQRLAEEERFEPISQLIDALDTKSDEIFAAAFDRNHIQHLMAEAEAEPDAEEANLTTPIMKKRKSLENQKSIPSEIDTDSNFTLNKCIKEFWESLEDRFMVEYISNNIMELLSEHITTYPDFFIKHYKKKIAKKLIDQINKFVMCFNTAIEEEWLVYIS